MTHAESIDLTDPPTNRHPEPTHAASREAGAGWLWLSGPIAVLGAIAAGSGIGFDSTYERDMDNFATQGVAQDYVTLLVGVPALVVLWRLAARGSLRARLLWQGAVFYFAYTYVIAAFMVRFNNLFLVYTSIVACSIFGMVGSLGALNRTLRPGMFDHDRWPRRGAIGLLVALVAMFAFLWLTDIVPALLDGTEPESLAEAGTPTNGVQVMDLALLLPGAAIIAFWVARSLEWGYVLATGLLTYTALLGLALVAMVVGQYNADFIDSPAPAVLFAALVAAAVGLLRKMMQATSP